MDFKLKPLYCVDIRWSNSKGTKKRTNENEKTIQQPNKKRKEKRERTKWTKAEEGVAVVIADVKNYIKEAEQQLTNTNIYIKLQEDPTAGNMKLVNDTIERFKKNTLIN